MVKNNALSTFIINPLIHIHQKKKIALEIAVKVASVNGPIVIQKLFIKAVVQIAMPN
jgi:hypothetical protein